MHRICGNNKFIRFNNEFSIDFAEIPSMLFTKWLDEDEILKKLSSHYKTRKPLPIELIETLKKKKNHFKTFDYVYAFLFHAQIDFHYHIGKVENLTALWHRIVKETLKVSFPPKTIPESSFIHPVTGNGGEYYSYAWADVNSFEIYSIFKKKGILNKKVGRELREKILAPGSSKEPEILLEEFLGRKPNVDEFLKKL